MRRQRFLTEETRRLARYVDELQEAIVKNGETVMRGNSIRTKPAARDPEAPPPYKPEPAHAVNDAAPDDLADAVAANTPRVHSILDAPHGFYAWDDVLTWAESTQTQIRVGLTHGSERHGVPARLPAQHRGRMWSIRDPEDGPQIGHTKGGNTRYIFTPDTVVYVAIWEDQHVVPPVDERTVVKNALGEIIAIVSHKT